MVTNPWRASGSWGAGRPMGWMWPRPWAMLPAWAVDGGGPEAVLAFVLDQRVAVGGWPAQGRLAFGTVTVRHDRHQARELSRYRPGTALPREYSAGTMGLPPSSRGSESIMANPISQTSTTSRAATGWRRASASTPFNDCVEVRVEPEHVRVRDSKGRHSAELRFDRRSWAGFVDLRGRSE